MEMTKKEGGKSELEIELEQTIDFLRKRMSEYEFEYNKQLRDIKFLEEENKKLKHEVEQFKKGVKAGTKIIERLEEENKNLKEQLERMKTDTMYDMKDINSLYKENQKLKEELSKLKEKYGDIDY